MGMPPKGKPLTLIDLAVIDTLRSRVKQRGLGTRSLSRESGIGLNRTGIILRAEGPAPTIGELDQMASALGTTASEILRESERSARRAPFSVVQGMAGEEYGQPLPAEQDLKVAQVGDVAAEQEGSQETP